MLKKILKNLLNKKGLSLTEVALSVALVAIIMVSGAAYFNSAWEIRAKTEEYNEVLYNVVANLENAKYECNGTDAGANLFQISETQNTSKRLTSRGTLVKYTVSGVAGTGWNDGTGAGSLQLTSSATFGSTQIIIVTHVCRTWNKNGDIH